MSTTESGESAESRFPKADPELVYDLGRRKIELQMQQIESLDSKAEGLFQACAALLGLLGGFIALWEHHIPASAQGFFTCGVVIFIGAAIAFVASFRTRQWGIGPTMAETWKFSGSFKPDKMKWWAAESFKKEATKNEPRIEFKASCANLLIFLFVAEMVALTIGLGLTVIAS